MRWLIVVAVLLDVPLSLWVAANRETLWALVGYCVSVAMGGTP